MYLGRVNSPTCSQPDSTPALVLPSSGMAARQRKGVTAERLFYCLLIIDHTRRSLPSETCMQTRSYQ
ncbi:hypothetical protein CSKR_106850 [Clonorchis sinensis]|uniref:Uncharacterized protein n=1 Tax=Clonorchis sinensis TaxID=79923 RepID=A0A3R7GGC2_CLOSI|nr:hypothetical protein CSKR_106850 [Clonorchis sinensis]